MRLACPQCEALYEIPEDAIPPEGRAVECSACGHRWRQGIRSEDAGEAAGGDPSGFAGMRDALRETADGPDDPNGDRDAADRADAGPDADADANADEDDFGDDGAAPEPEPDLPPRPPVRDPEDLRVLREEAEREARLRRGDTRPEGMSDDMADGGAADGAEAAAGPGASGDPAPAPRVVPTRPPRGARRDEATARPLAPPADPAPPPPSGDAPIRPSRPPRAGGESPADRTRQAGRGDRAAPDDEAATPARRRSGFAGGFLGAIAVAAILAGVYLFGGEIARAVPSATGPLDAYVDAVNALRVEAERLARRAVAATGGG